MERVDVYFRNSDKENIITILGVEAWPYQEDISWASAEPGCIDKLKKCGFAIGLFFWHEVGGEGTGQFAPKLNIHHPVKGKIRFSTQTASEMLTYKIPTTQEKGIVDDRVEISSEHPICGAFSAYSFRFGDEPAMVIYKRPSTIRREQALGLSSY